MPNLPLALSEFFALLVLACLALPRRPDRLFAALGLPGFALGSTALSLQSGLVVPPSFLQINVGLLALGVLLPLGSAAVALRHPGRASRLQATLGLVLAIGLLAVLAPLWAVAGPRALLYGGMMALVAAGLGALFGLLRFGPALAWLDRQLAPLPAPAAGWSGATSLGVALTMIGAIGMVLTRHLGWMLIVASVIALGSQAFLWRRRLVPRVPGPGLAVPLLALTLWLCVSDAGWQGLGSFGEPPFSPAAEVVLVPLVAAAAWFLAGLWPAHGLVARLPLALVAGVMAERLLDAMPLGLAHWQPVLVPLLVIGLWFGAAVPRWGVMLTAWGFLGIVCAAGVPAWWLLAGAVLAPWLDRVPTGRWRDLIGRVFWGAMAVAAWQVLGAGLKVEVVYSVLAVVGTAAALWRGQARPIATS